MIDPTVIMAGVFVILWIALAREFLDRGESK